MNAVKQGKPKAEAKPKPLSKAEKLALKVARIERAVVGLIEQHARSRPKDFRRAIRERTKGDTRRAFLLARVLLGVPKGLRISRFDHRQLRLFGSL